MAEKIHIAVEYHSLYAETLDELLIASGNVDLPTLIETALGCYEFYENNIVDRPGSMLSVFLPTDRYHPDHHTAITDAITQDHVLLGQFNLTLSPESLESLPANYDFNDYSNRITRALIVYEHVLNAELSGMCLGIYNPATGLQIVAQSKPRPPFTPPPSRHIH